MSALLSATIIIVSNAFKKEKIVLDKRYAIKAGLLFLLTVAILYVLEQI
jgi:hypothetical protein